MAKSPSKTKSPSKSQRKWKPGEFDLLIDLVKDNYSFLTDGLHPGKTKPIVNTKWHEITHQINSLGLHPIPLTMQQVRKKWQDEKSLTKKKNTGVKRSRQKTGGGQNEEPDLTERQQKIKSIIPAVALNGIPNTNACDTLAPSNNELMAIGDVQNPQPSVSGPQLYPIQQPVEVSTNSEMYSMASPAYSSISALLEAVDVLNPPAVDVLNPPGPVAQYVGQCKPFNGNPS